MDPTNPAIQIDRQQITPVVSTLLGEPVIALGEWDTTPISGGLEVANRLLRVSGEARTPEGLRPWSLVLKIVHRLPTSDTNPNGLHYWKREALAYQSGMLKDLPGGMAAPRCYAASQVVEGQYWLWLEEVNDDLGKPWPVEHFREVARCLGRFNAAYLVGQTLPDQPWLAHRWLRTYVETAAPQVQALPELRALPLFQRCFPSISNEFIQQTWEQRGEFLGAIERLPQTFCHQDAFIGNLFWQRGAVGLGRVVGLDWAYTGIAAVGEELAPLVAMSSDQSNGWQLYEICLEGYLTGLAEAGWKTDPQQVRFSSLATIFYRYLFGAVLGEMWTYLLDERNHPRVAAMFGLPDIGVLCDEWGIVNPVYQMVFESCRQILTQLS